MKRLTYRTQCTIAQSVEIEGTGFITGKHVRLRFMPAPANSGVVFARTDLGKDARIPARSENVTGTQRRTTLGHAPVCVGLVEHVLAALKGLHVDNCLVELNASEPPGLDGSAWGFTQALCSVGTVVQGDQLPVYGVESSVVIEHQGATLALHPSDAAELRVSYLLDYGPHSPIVRQVYTAVITPETFLQNICQCRTFLLEDEANMLRQQGIGAKTKFCDLLVFGPRGPIDNALRFGNEPARHKVLDILGDFALLGADLRGHIVAYRSGHPLNVEMVRTLKGQVSTVMPRRRAA